MQDLSLDKTRMNAALGLLSKAYSKGSQIRVRQGSVLVQSIDDNALVRDIKTFSKEVAALLIGAKKPWAHGYHELCLAFDEEGNSITNMAAVILKDRQAIHSCDINPLTLSKEILSATSIILEGLNYKRRIAFGKALCNAGKSGRIQAEIFETNIDTQDDYRNFLTGSFWLKMDTPKSDDLISRAVFSALKIRSVKKNSIDKKGAGFYMATYVRHLINEGFTEDEITQETGLSNSFVSTMMSKTRKIPASDNASPRPLPKANYSGAPTPKQLKFIKNILKDMPFLEAKIGSDFQNNRTTAKAFLDQYGKSYLQYQDEAKRLRVERWAREEIANGSGFGFVEEGLPDEINLEDLLRPAFHERQECLQVKILGS